MGTVFISGANRGLGLEFVKQYKEAGWRIHGTARSPEEADELQALAKEGQIEIHKLDVRNFDDIESLAGDLEGEAIDVLINNAGIYGTKKNQQFGSVDYKEWEKVFTVNTMAPLKMTEAFMDHVEKSGEKKVAIVTSLMGSIADNGSGGNYLYRTSKAAVNMVAKSLSVDLKSRGITIVLLHPGWVETDMGGENAPISPEESIRGMRQVIEETGLDQSATFFKYDGTTLPW